jgi:aryl-alcohol dehydrogenase-like predicted oxidoreductase
VFLATKTNTRDGEGARTSLERSLDRLGVESVDLIQLHNLVEPDEWDAAFAPGGAVEALAAARDEGLAGHIGVTGHGLRIARAHIRSLERFDFASVLLPVNFVLMREPGYRADVEELLMMCADRQVAVQTIKSIARGRWDRGDGRRFSWYEPLTDPDAIARAVRFGTSSLRRRSTHPAPRSRRRTSQRCAETSPRSASHRSSTATDSNASEARRLGGRGCCSEVARAG